MRSPEPSEAEPSRHLPLRPRDYLILFSVATQARHGYGIIRRVGEVTSGTVTLDPANLYRAVKRLVREGLMEEADVDEPTDETAGTERRRFWTVTELGRRVVTAEATRLARLAELATSAGLITGEG